METSYAFQAALRNGDFQKVETLISEQPNFVNEPDERGYPPIVMAAYHNQINVVDLLLKNQVNIDAVDPSGNTALMGTCFKGFEVVTEQLIKAGANLNAQNGNGSTAFAFACMFNHRELANLLLQYGADPSLEDHKGVSAVEHAKRQGIDWPEILVKEHLEG